MITASARFAASKSLTHTVDRMHRVEARAYSVHNRENNTDSAPVYLILERQGASVDSCMKLRMLPADARELAAQLMAQADRVDPPLAPVCIKHAY